MFLFTLKPKMLLFSRKKVKRNSNTEPIPTIFFLDKKKRVQDMEYYNIISFDNKLNNLNHTYNRKE